LFLGMDIHHSILGIVGLGRIGIEMAKRAKGFDMDVQYYDAFRNEKAEKDFGIKFVDMKTLLETSDFVSLHVPLNENTKHLIGEREFEMMKPTAILVNSSRGPVVDQKALYVALKEKKIWAAGLDVFEVEPISMDDPILTLDNIVVVPHIASASVATRAKMGIKAAENLIAGVQGKEIPYRANPDVGQNFRK
jgi:lactate dehydrogenase-like 2-hydroxyacid dehydrogenase